MLQAGYSWRLYFYVVLAFTILLFILAFFFAEETSYDRKTVLAEEAVPAVAPAVDEKDLPVHDEMATTGNQTRTQEYVRPRREFLQTLSPAGRIDHELPFFLTMIRSFSYFLVPQALWVITTYGIAIGLGSFAISLTFPTRIIQPPYNWQLVSVYFSFVTPLYSSAEHA